jgi:hypothetical protein
MEEIDVKSSTPLCPSARPEVGNSAVFGIVAGTVEKPQVAYLKQVQPLTDELIALSGSVTPGEVFRVAAPCAGTGCQHFDGANCRLATRVANQLAAVSENLPPCPIRRECRWWQQEGKAACMRCPQVITDNYSPSEQIRQVATPVAV